MTESAAAGAATLHTATAPRAADAVKIEEFAAWRVEASAVQRDSTFAESLKNCVLDERRPNATRDFARSLASSKALSPMPIKRMQ